MSQRIVLHYSEDLPGHPGLRRLERLALADRQALGLRFGEACDPRRLAAWHDVEAIVETYEDYQRCLGAPVDQIAAAIANLVDAWSCLMIAGAGGQYLMLVNPHDAPTRRTLTIGHEFGHLTCGHQPVRLDPIDLDDGLALRQPRYSDAQELEAFDYALALLVPYAPLLQLLTAGLPPVAIARHFGVSPDAIAMRLSRLSLQHPSGVAG